MTKDNFIEKCEKIHNHKYIYDLVPLKFNTHDKITIICPEHGKFEQIAASHLIGKGCRKCANENNSKKRRNTLEKLIDKSRKIHQIHFDFSKTVYPKNKNEDITIICPIHGEFKTTPHKFLNSFGCPKCGIEAKNFNRRMKLEEFISRAKEIHDDMYDFSKTIYPKNVFDKCIVTCKEHGDFITTPLKILKSIGCPLCSKKNKNSDKRDTKEKFLEKALKKHGNFYYYSKVVYKNSRTKVIITCPKHGDFEILPSAFLNHSGCPHCKKSLLENEVYNFLIKKNIKFETQKRFDWLITDKGGMMSLDFYFKNKNIAIECQGIQHFKIHGWSTKQVLEEIQNRDKLKARLCNEHGIKILYYSNLKIKYPYQVFEDINVLFNEIFNDE